MTQVNVKKIQEANQPRLFDKEYKAGIHSNRIVAIDLNRHIPPGTERHLIEPAFIVPKAAANAPAGPTCAGLCVT